MVYGAQQLPDILKMLIQTTGNQAPDNPAEVLTIFDGSEETMHLADVWTTPNFGHAASYLYNNATSLYGLAEYS